MQTAIITDSNSGIFEAEGKEKGIFVVPMPVIIEERTYYEGVDITRQELYGVLSAHKKASTSQPAPAEVLAVWDQALNNGYDELVYIPMSSGLSGSCQTAQALAQEYDGRVEVVDNRRISITLRHAVLDALKLREQGYNAAQIREMLENEAAQSIVYVGVSTLEYLKANGRVTPAGAAIGTILDIKPLLVIEGERLDAYAKVRGTRHCQRKLIEAMQTYAQTYYEHGESIYVSAAGSFEHEEDTLKWIQMIKEAFPENQIHYDPLTFSICCHVGLNAFGMGISKVLI